MMKKFALAAVAMLALGGAVRAADTIDPIATRQTGLDLLAGTWQGIRGVVAAKGDVKVLENPGKAVARWGDLMPSLFPAGSDKGATKAAPAIWSDHAGFVKASAALSASGAALATAAKAGDQAGVEAAVKAMGDACGACHKDYRLK